MDIVQAAVFRDGSVDACLENLTLRDVHHDEVLVRIVATGICHSDLTFRDGFFALPRPIVLGHEGSGIVERVGASVSSVVPGDKVVISFLSCGKCQACDEGEPAYCDAFMPANASGRRLDGTTALCRHGVDVASHFFGQSSFATYSVANMRNVVKVRADAPIELLGPLGCGVQTGAGSVFHVLNARKGQSLAVFGAGAVGLSAVMAAKSVGCDPIIVIEPNAARRDLAVELGATHAFDPADGAAVEAVNEVTGGRLRNALDTSGIPEVIGQALQALGARGRLALVTANSLEAVIPIHILSLVGKGISIRGVNMGDSNPQVFIPRLVDLVMAGDFPVEKLVKFYALDDLNAAMADQQSGAVVKPIVRIS